MGKQLVAYFSATGTTEAAARQLAQAAGADLYRIEPAVPYTAADLDWRDEASRSTIEMKSRASRPQIAGSVGNMADYDVVYLGFPVWWYREPSIIDTFLEQYDFAGKTIVLFATSGSSGLEGAPGSIAALVPESTRIVEGVVLTSSTPREALIDWFKGL